MKYEILVGACEKTVNNVTLQKLLKNSKQCFLCRGFVVLFWIKGIMIKELTLKQRIITLFLALVFIVYVGNVSLFVHTHKVGDITIVHSHPSTSSSHAHSTNAISALSCLGHFDSLTAAISGENNVFLVLLSVIEDGRTFSIQGERVLNISLRAPPVL